MEDCRSLREETKELIASWEYHGIDPLDPESGTARMESYIQTILPKEISCARCDKSEPLRWPTYDLYNRTLVLMVGFSIDPLLLSICAYNPSQVVLILNERYGDGPQGKTGNEFGDYVGQFITQLHPEFVETNISKADNNLAFVKLDKDQPTDVFRKLREVLLPRLRSGERLILDVTGGKKSMVTGAFLFGAFAGVDISYVDFDEYDPESRSPRSYTCRIGLLPNPYETFRLREWERVRQLYNRYAFSSARKLLGQLILGMEDLFRSEDIAAANVLMKALSLYEFWDNGNYKAANEGYSQSKNLFVNGPKLRLPMAVEVLGAESYWPHVEDALSAGEAANQLSGLVGTLQFNQGDMKKSLYLETDRLLIYAHDEIAKVQRLIDMNEDYRSALLRAAGLYEILCRSRLLWHRGWLTLTPPNTIDRENAEILLGLRMNLVHDLLTSSTAKVNSLTRPRVTIERSNADPHVPQAVPVLNSDDLASSSLPKLRNRAIHFYLPVTKRVAKASCEIAFESLKDFRDNWAKFGSATTLPSDIFRRAVDWNDLCEACGITFLPSL